nr:hypothetical protein [Thermoanaerobaculia bacterium]
ESAALAGFCFTLAVLRRSNVHRLTLACAGAVGLALSLVPLSGADADALATGRVTFTALRKGMRMGSVLARPRSFLKAHRSSPARLAAASQLLNVAAG